MSEKAASEKVAVFDTTLRDGEQAAGTRLGSREKLIIARQLALLNVDVIEAGYPNSSPEDFEAVQLIGREIHGPAICALSRAVAADIEACGKALAQCRRPRIHTGIGASNIHIGGKFQDERYGKTLAEKKRTILAMAVEAVKLARQFADDVEFYAEDAGRADADYLFEMIASVVAAGATVVNIPDTTGYTVPEQYGSLIRSLKENVPGIERAVISVHCHDDLGMAVVGPNAFSHSSGIHVDGFLKQRDTYEIMRPEDVGMMESRVVLTARTGRHGLLDRLRKLGYPLSEQELDQAYRRFLIVADKKQEVFDEDLMAIMYDEIHLLPATFELQYLHIYSGTSAIPTATVRMRVKDVTQEGAAIGDGPVDAVCRAISQVTNTAAKLRRYEIHGVTSGTEAMGEVTVHLEDGGRKVVGRGASTVSESPRPRPSMVG